MTRGTLCHADCSRLALLPNQRIFLLGLRQRVGLRQQTSIRPPLAIIFLSVSQFGLVGRSFKRKTNSHILRALAGQLLRILPRSSRLTQINKSRFTFLLALGSRDRLSRLLSHMRQRLTRPVALTGRHLSVADDVNVIVTHTSRPLPPRSLLQSTRATVCHTGALDRSHCRIFTAPVHRRTIQQLRLRDRLLRTVRQHRFLLRCRPVIYLRGHRVVKFRTLMQ